MSDGQGAAAMTAEAIERRFESGSWTSEDVRVCVEAVRSVQALRRSAGGYQVTTQEWRKQWSHKPTPIPAADQMAGLWYSEGCVDQMLADYTEALQQEVIQLQEDKTHLLAVCAEYRERLERQQRAVTDEEKAKYSFDAQKRFLLWPEIDALIASRAGTEKAGAEKEKP